MTEERLAERREYKRKWRIANRDKIHNYNQRQREKKIAAGLITPRLKEEDTLTEEQKKASDEACADLKTPRELQEEFERLHKDDQKVILEAYEKLGFHVVAEQCKEYKDLYSAYLTANNDMKRASLMAGLKKIRRWMRHDLNTWVVTELTGDEICNKLERVVEEEQKSTKRRRK